MQQNAYLLAKIGADAAENERIFAKKLARWQPALPTSWGRSPPSPGTPGWEGPAGGTARGRTCFFFCKILQFLAGSFSAVSKRNFARKYAFDSIFQALQDLHPFAPLQSHNFRKKNRFEKTAFFVKFQQKKIANVAKFAKFCQISKISA